MTGTLQIGNIEWIPGPGFIWATSQRQAACQIKGIEVLEGKSTSNWGFPEAEIHLAWLAVALRCCACGKVSKKTQKLLKEITLGEQ
jgi:hypothetical protein